MTGEIKDITEEQAKVMWGLAEYLSQGILTPNSREWNSLFPDERNYYRDEAIGVMKNMASNGAVIALDEPLPDCERFNRWNPILNKWDTSFATMRECCPMAGRKVVVPLVEPALAPKKVLNISVSYNAQSNQWTVKDRNEGYESIFEGEGISLANDIYGKGAVEALLMAARNPGIKFRITEGI